MLQALCKKLPASRRKEAERYLQALIELGPVEPSKTLTWFDVFEEMPTSQGEGPKVRLELCEQAAKLLKRPPTLEDIETDFLHILFKKIGREYSGHYGSKGVFLRRRLDALKRLAAHCSAKYKLAPIDWQGFLLSRRAEIESEIEAGQPGRSGQPGRADKSSGGVLDKPVTIDAKFSTVLLSDVVTRYINEKLLGKSANSPRLLLYAERKFSEYLTRPALLSDLNTETVRRYLAYLLESNLSRSGKKLSRRSVLCNQERLNSLWRFASKKGWLHTEPDLPLVTLPEVAPEAWTREEMEAILKAAAAVPDFMPGVMSKVPYSLYWQALIYFLSDTGERIGGALGIDYADIGGEWVTVRAEHRKGKTRDKQFKLRPCTLDAIQQLRQRTNSKEVTKVFHWPLSPTYLWGRFKKVLELAELPDTRRNKFHKFRRTTATEFEAAGGNASKLLDHRNRSTTEKYLDTRLIGELMPADIVPGIGEQRTKGRIERGAAAGGAVEPGQPGKELTNDELLAKMRALLGGGK